MDDSEVYEDAQSKVDLYSKSNTASLYQEAQSKLNITSKRNKRKSDSSIYQDAQSRITNNSRINSHKNSFSKISVGKDNNKDFLKINNIYKMENNQENLLSRNLKLKNEDDGNDNNDNISDIDNNENNLDNNEEKNKKNTTIFEGDSNNGGCCNIPKCQIF